MVLCLEVILLCFLTCLHGSQVPAPPKITKQPPAGELPFRVKEYDHDYDKPLYIECEATGHPSPKYHWLKNGEPYFVFGPEDRIARLPDRGTLYIMKPQNGDAGQYQCFAENEWGTATSNSVFAREIEFLPFDNSPPLSVSGNEGQPFKLSCPSPDGWPKPELRWVTMHAKDATKTINSSGITEDPEGNLWFSSLKKEYSSDDFTYTCLAAWKNLHEYRLRKSVFLNVVASGTGPSLSQHEAVRQYVSEKNVQGVRGKSVELFCIFGGKPLPQVIWSKDKSPIEYSDRVAQERFGKSLVIKQIDYEDAGTYTCEVSNGVGKIHSHSISLEVLVAPYFTEEPDFTIASENDTVEFHCRASGVPEPQIQWIHNGKPIAEAPGRKITPNSILFEKVTKKDIGNYGCNASNPLGYVYKDVYLNVLALPPEIVTKLGEVQGVEGGDATLQCEAVGVPKPTVKWTVNGTKLSGDRFKVSENGFLQISNVEFEDGGNYTCHAENKFGYAERIVIFDIVGVRN